MEYLYRPVKLELQFLYEDFSFWYSVKGLSFNVTAYKISGISAIP